MTYRFIIQIYPIDARCCDWQLGLKATAISIELRQPVGNRDNGLSSLPCFHTFSAVTETSLIASLPRQHPINLLNKGCSPAVLFAENWEDLVRPHWKAKGEGGNWGWIRLIVAGKLSLLKPNNIRNLIAAVDIDVCWGLNIASALWPHLITLSLVFWHSQLCSPGAFCAFICIVALWIKASVFMAIFFFYAVIDPFQRGWQTLFFSILSSNSTKAAYSEMTNHWCIVMWPRDGRITAQPFVPLYLADNLFEGDINVNVLAQMYVFYNLEKPISPLDFNGLDFCV